MGAKKSFRIPFQVTVGWLGQNSLTHLPTKGNKGAEMPKSRDRLDGEIAHYGKTKAAFA